ncbi:MAG: ArnT family glycosyltransferase, partial [Acidobacteriota bacterium]
MNPEYPYNLKGSTFAIPMKPRSLQVAYSRIRPTRVQVVAWLALLIIAVAISVRDYDAYQFGTHWDDSQYATLARSLVFSDHFGLINGPGEPLPAKYPFAYPLLLVPFVLFAPENFDALKSLSLIATLMNAALIFWCWRSFSRTRSYNWALAITGLYVLAPMIIDHTRRVMSEPIFTTFCLLALALTEQAARGQRGRWWTVQMSLALLFALFTRTIGFVLIVTVLAYLLIRLGRNFWKEIVLIVVGIALLLGVIVAATPVSAIDLIPAEYFKDNNAKIIVGADFPDETADAGSPAVPSDGETPALLPLDQRIKNIVIGWLRYQFGTYPRRVVFPIGGGDKEQAVADSIGLSFLPAMLGYMVAGVIVLGLWRFL